DRRVSTGPEGWLLGERPLPGTAGERKYYCGSPPADTPLPRLVALAHARWASAQCYEEAQGACGLDDYQGRRWDGLHRHVALVMLAYSFLAVQALPQLPGGAPAPFPPAAPAQSAGRASADPGLVVPRSGALAHRTQPNTPLPSAEKLTQ